MFVTANREATVQNRFLLFLLNEKNRIKFQKQLFKTIPFSFVVSRFCYKICFSNFYVPSTPKNTSFVF